MEWISEQYNLTVGGKYLLADVLDRILEDWPTNVYHSPNWRVNQWSFGTVGLRKLSAKLVYRKLMENHTLLEHLNDKWNR